MELLVAAAPEFIKMARSLTMTSTRATSRAAFEATLAFARGHGTSVIAEGIEHQRSTDQMVAMGVRLGQGFGVGKPAAAGSIIEPPGEWTAHHALRHHLRNRGPRRQP